ncbi:MAG: trehalose-phosphatase [Pseudomonadota bacterium]
MTVSRARPPAGEYERRPEAWFMDNGLVAVDTASPAPEPARNWALFLDLDGTLLDIAATPTSVVVPPDLVSDLQGAARALNGAVAIVSGRALTDIDGLLKPLRLATGSEHGAVVRLPDGTEEQLGKPVPHSWAQALLDLQAACPGILTEVKPHNVVAHFRNAPDAADKVMRLARQLVARAPQEFELMEAKMAVEIRPRAVTKARPVHRLMAMAPFAGRTPVFVGDDVTDEDGFEAALAHGGLALNVAVRFNGQPQEVRAWLKRVADL